MVKGVGRNAASPHIDALNHWAKGHRHRAAGVWFDNGLGESGPMRIGVGVVGDGTEAVTAELRGLMAHPDRLDVVSMRFTEFHLRAIQQLITAERMHIRTHPTCRVTMTGVDIHANKTTAGIDPFDEGFAAELRTAYGSDRLVVEAQAQVRFLAGGDQAQMSRHGLTPTALRPPSHRAPNTPPDPPCSAPPRR
jgi:hypothetical protein